MTDTRETLRPARDAGAARAWVAPVVVRLEAGAAEQGTRQIVNDGPLQSYS